MMRKYQLVIRAVKKTQQSEAMQCRATGEGPLAGSQRSLSGEKTFELNDKEEPTRR